MSISIMGTGYGIDFGTAAAWTGRNLKDGTEAGINEAFKVTFAEIFREILLKPLAISKIQKFFNLDKSKNLKIKAEFMHNLAKSIEHLHKVAKDKKQFEMLADKLGQEYETMLDHLIKLLKK